MRLQKDIRHGLRIGRADLIHSVRHYLQSERRVFGLLLLTLFGGPGLLLFGFGLYELGREIKHGDVAILLGAAAVVVALAITCISVVRTVGDAAYIENDDLVLLAVHPRAAVIGVLSAELARLVVWTGVPTILLVLSFFAGLGAPWLSVIVLLLSVPVVCCMLICGLACGLGIVGLVNRHPTAGRRLKCVGIIALIAGAALLQWVGVSDSYTESGLRAIGESLAVPPLTEYVALAFVGTPLVRAMSFGAVTVLVGSVVVTLCGVEVATRLARGVWFNDGATHTAPMSDPTTRGFHPPWPCSRARAGRIAWGLLARTRRDPSEIGHLNMLLSFIIPGSMLFFEFWDAGNGPLVAGLGVLSATVLAGAAFCLNPLGEDCTEFPLLLLTDTPGQTLVRGRVAAGLAIGLPFAVLVPLGSIFLGTDPVQAVAYALAGAGLCFPAALSAIGLGAAIPVYETQDVFGAETVPASVACVAVYLVVVVTGTLYGLILAEHLAAVSSLASPALNDSDVGYLLATAAIPYLSYRYAIRRYRRYMLA